MQPTISRETILIDRRQPALRWSAVFAGATCSAGFWLLLQVLGLGIGLASIDVDNAGSLRGVGLGTTVWSLIAPLFAMFLGGLVAGRLATTTERKIAGMHGLVMWALTSIVGLWATIWIVTMVAGGAIRTGGAAINAAGNMTSAVAGQVEPGSTLRDLRISPDDLLGPINLRLAAQGKPQLTANELEAAMRGVVRGGLAQGGIDRELLVRQLAANTRMSRADAEDIANQVEAQWNTLRGRAEDVAQRAAHAALSAADAAGKALTTVGVSLLLSLITAVAGAILALHRGRRGGGGDEPRRGRTTPEPSAPSAAPPSEAVTTTTAPYPRPMIAPAAPAIPPNEVR
jgi:hypothetical protein